jgi:hypothetical protein
MTEPFGASQEEWAHFDFVLGLGEHLLPVVCNPKAVPSPRSSVKGPCRTPSLYNRDRQLVGIKDWTSLRANGELKRWAGEPDYGICIQTREMAGRGIDIDVNGPMAEQIQEAIEMRLGKLPCRRRSGTLKRLLMVRVRGLLAKRVLRVEGGAIEFLADGQMFVAVGSREDGSRYYWEGGLPFEIPEISLEQFEDLWDMLVLAFGVGETSVARLPGPGGQDIEADDPVADWLGEQGLVLDERERGLVIACPWEEEHSSGETGDGSTMWMLAGGRGHEQGHFRCLHAHCEGRTRGDYLAAVGYVEDVTEMFPVIELTAEEVQADEGVAGDRLPAFDRERNGAIKAHINNVALGVASRMAAGMVVAYDQFRDEIMWGPGGMDGWQRFTDVDYTRLQMRLERWGFKPLSREMLRAAVEEVARRNQFDSAIIWLREKVPAWDGIPRVDMFLADFFGVDDNAYTRGVARYIWTALAGRVLEPGCKADMVPIFVGPQGGGKSTAVARLAPTEEVFTEVSLHDKEDDLSRRLKGRLVIELGELRGLHTRELEAIKAWITRRIENWVPKYKEFATQYARRCIFFGTTNQEQFLADSTGNRRWLPVRVGKIESFSANLEQLWAEAREMFLKDGVYFEVEKLAAEAHEEHTMVDPWQAAIGKWLETPDALGGGCPGDREFLTVAEVAEGALGLDLRRQTARSDQMRVGEVLRTSFGYRRERKRLGNDRAYAYVRQKG